MASALIVISDINPSSEVSFRTAVSSESDFGGQGFHKCNCGPNHCKKTIGVNASKQNSNAIAGVMAAFPAVISNIDHIHILCFKYRFAN